jgi:hypothetical protein
VIGFELRCNSGSVIGDLLARDALADGRGGLGTGELTGLENLFELRGSDDGEAVGDDGVGCVVAVVVDEDFVGGRHVGDLWFVWRVWCVARTWWIVHGWLYVRCWYLKTRAQSSSVVCAECGCDDFHKGRCRPLMRQQRNR